VPPNASRLSGRRTRLTPELPIRTRACGTLGIVDGTYDPEVDAAYLRLIPTLEAGSSKRQVVARTDLAGEFVFDVDEDGRIIGIEVLDATAVLRPETIAQLQRLGTL
jgi:uncharacterized protein YuzE